MRQPSIITRFTCRNSDTLADIGVSSEQFQEYFEKFISKICKNEYATSLDGFKNAFVLKDRRSLLHDWMDAIVSVYGSSLVDSTKSSPFETNPGYINTMESNLSIFDESGDEIGFKLQEIIRNLT
jgi:hypothetical protein